MRPRIEVDLLQSEKQRISTEIHQHIGSKKATRGSRQFLPILNVDESFENEFEDNKETITEEVRQSNVSRDANLIRFHVAYKLGAD